MKVTKLDKVQVRAIHDAMTTALQTVAEQYGIKVSAAGGRYERDGSTGQLRFDISVDNPELQEGVKRERFQLNAALFGLKPEHYGQTFRSQSGRILRIIDINLGRSKNCIVLEDLQGKQFAGSPSIVIAALKTVAGETGVVK